ncbi:hypothetical protein PoB_007540900 [Plakobranchus ocellatus]|uniref:Uncharacterized protein n=1 Tax=Plakobranchus ocellatus TaxID=259542 RepID=A0AAV4DXV7_9GAST|nr:hypothetical protein PoB_007540900 [Plakobranchus ocellatus]
MEGKTEEMEIQTGRKTETEKEEGSLGRYSGRKDGKDGDTNRWENRNRERRRKLRPFSGYADDDRDEAQVSSSN